MTDRSRRTRAGSARRTGHRRVERRDRRPRTRGALAASGAQPPGRSGLSGPATAMPSPRRRGRRRPSVRPSPPTLRRRRRPAGSPRGSVGPALAAQARRNLEQVRRAIEAGDRHEVVEELVRVVGTGVVVGRRGLVESPPQSFTIGAVHGHSLAGAWCPGEVRSGGRPTRGTAVRDRGRRPMRCWDTPLDERNAVLVRPRSAGRDAARPAALSGGVARRSVQLMWRGMAANPGTYLLAVGLSAVFGAATVGVSQLLGMVTDRVVLPALTGDKGARADLGTAGLVLVAVAVVLAVGVAGRRIFAGVGYADIQAGHRRGVTRQYLRLPMSWHRAHPTGQLLANASSDVEAATGVFNPLPFALGVVVMILVAAVALFSIDTWLALTALTVLPLATVANVVFQRYMSPAATHAQQLRAHVPLEDDVGQG